MGIQSWLPPLRRQLATLSQTPPITHSPLAHVAKPNLSSPPIPAFSQSTSSAALQTPPAHAEVVLLGLESSADDSCAAVVSSTRGILSNIVLKQHLLHESFGGIHPLFAQKAHQAQLPIAIRSALREANVHLGELDGIAFTRGPGMPGCLATCSMAAKGIAAVTGLPLIGVHHMQAHALTPFLTEAIPPTFPFLTLLLSGGHTLLLIAKSESKFQILATTTDESIGSCLDKACRDLLIDWAVGNGSPGAALEATADFPSLLSSSLYPSSPAPSPSDLILPPLPIFKLPYKIPTLAFSYAGMRSALTRHLLLEDPVTMSGERKREIARRFMGCAFEQVAEKVRLGLVWWEREGEDGKGKGEVLGSLVVSGGVASNQFLRTKLRQTLDKAGYAEMRLIFPPPSLCTDNAAMIASVGISRLCRGRVDELDVMSIAKWSIEECEVNFEGRRNELGGE